MPCFPLTQPAFQLAFPPESVVIVGVKRRLGLQPRYRPITVDKPQFLCGGIPRDGYAFKTTDSEGAILILPDGAVRSELGEVDALRQHVEKFALEICNWVNQDKLWLITSMIKSKSWTLGSFYGEPTGSDISVSPQLSDGAGGTSTYNWVSHMKLDTDFQLGPENNDNFNQTIFLRGFKIVRWRWLAAIVELAEGQDLSFVGHLAQMCLNKLPERWVTETSKLCPML